jgi:protein-tyrosine-phosphatase
MLRAMTLARRAEQFAALGDRHRLAIVDALATGDLTAHEAAAAAGVPMNLAAHHLAVLETAGLVERRVSEGDRRRRYVVLCRDTLATLLPVEPTAAPAGPVLFVCTHNSARSQFAAGLWRQRARGAASSAGSEPARRVHPQAIRAGRRRGVDLDGAVPRGYDDVTEQPTLVVSVCDRARETGVPFDAPMLHWSVPDPVPDGRARAFAAAFDEIADRVERLAAGGAAT